METVYRGMDQPQSSRHDLLSVGPLSAQPSTVIQKSSDAIRWPVRRPSFVRHPPLSVTRPPADRHLTVIHPPTFGTRPPARPNRSPPSRRPGRLVQTVGDRRPQPTAPTNRGIMRYRLRAGGGGAAGAPPTARVCSQRTLDAVNAGCSPRDTTNAEPGRPSRI